MTNRMKASIAILIYFACNSVLFGAFFTWTHYKSDIVPLATGLVFGIIGQIPAIYLLRLTAEGDKVLDNAQ